MERDARNDWPEWGEALRPDDLARARIRRAVRDRSAGLLARRRSGMWPVLEGWAGYLAPVAAAVAILCSWAATHDAALESPASTARPAGAEVSTVLSTDGSALPVSEVETGGERAVETSFLSSL